MAPLRQFWHAACSGLGDMTRRELNFQKNQKSFCGEKQDRIDEFVEASRELADLNSQQTQSVIDEDPDFARFDDLLHMAREKKERAKYSLIAHIQEHNC